MNFDEQCRGAFPATTPSYQDIFYGGVDRMEWFDVDEDYYAGSLPQEINAIRETIKKACADFTGIKICSNLQSAIKLLDYSNRIQTRNEIIAVSSPTLIKLKGSLNIDSSHIHWLGYDVICLGHWSLLCDGLFARPGAFERWLPSLNKHGLFSSDTVVEDYNRDYRQAALHGLVEELPQGIYATEGVRVGRVVTKKT